MLKFLLKWPLMALAVMTAAYLVPGVKVAGFWSALWVAVFMALVNLILRPILLILTLPVNLLTLGLFTLVINAAMVALTASVIKGFEVKTFLAALFFSLVLSIISYILNSFLEI